MVHEITRTRSRHNRLRDFQLHVPVHSMQLLSDGRLCVGSASTFTLYNLHDDSHPICKYLFRNVAVVGGMQTFKDWWRSTTVTLFSYNILSTLEGGVTFLFSYLKISTFF